MTNYFNFDISKEASVFMTAFYIVGYSDYLKNMMKIDPNVLPNYSSLPVVVKELDMVNNKIELKYPAFYITVDCNIISRDDKEEFVVRCWPVMDNVGILTTQEKSTKMNFNEYKTFISMFETDTDYLY